MKHFGKNLRFYRRHRDFTLEELGAKTGISSSHLSEVENGKKSISLEKAIALTYALECAIEDLVAAVSPLEKAINSKVAKRAKR